MVRICIAVCYYAGNDGLGGLQGRMTITNAACEAEEGGRMRWVSVCSTARGLSNKRYEIQAERVRWLRYASAREG